MTRELKVSINEGTKEIEGAARLTFAPIEAVAPGRLKVASLLAEWDDRAAWRTYWRRDRSTQQGPRPSAQLGFEIGAHALRATAATNALDHQADIAKVQEWLGHANIATTRIYDHRKSRPEDTDVQGQLLTSHFQDASNRQ